jgi:hypothetical protein
MYLVYNCVLEGRDFEFRSGYRLSELCPIYSVTFQGMVPRSLAAGY